jgi:hypothetical protein
LEVFLKANFKIYIYNILIVEMGRKGSESSDNHEEDFEEEEEVVLILFRFQYKNKFNRKLRD